MTGLGTHLLRTLALTREGLAELTKALIAARHYASLLDHEGSSLFRT